MQATAKDAFSFSLHLQYTGKTAGGYTNFRKLGYKGYLL